MCEKDNRMIEEIKESLRDFIVRTVNDEKRPTSACEVQVLAEVVNAFCVVVDLSNSFLVD